MSFQGNFPIVTINSYSFIAYGTKSRHPFFSYISIISHLYDPRSFVPLGLQTRRRKILTGEVRVIAKHKISFIILTLKRRLFI